MKMHRMICLAAGILTAQSAYAKLPFSNEVFGRIDGTLDFCAKSSPQLAQKFEEGKKELVRNLAKQEVTDARNSKEYKDAYEWIGTEFAKQSKENAAQACSSAVEGDK